MIYLDIFLSPNVDMVLVVLGITFYLLLVTYNLQPLFLATVISSSFLLVIFICYLLLGKLLLVICYYTVLVTCFLLVLSCCLILNHRQRLQKYSTLPVRVMLYIYNSHISYLCINYPYTSYIYTSVSHTVTHYLEMPFLLFCMYHLVIIPIK